MTLYPESKCSSSRAIDMLERFGTDRIWMNSACDWGISRPLAVPHAAIEMKQRAHSHPWIDKVVYQNPVAFMQQSPRFRLP
jgi:predicted metal-dependent TIM-barrel fold hydrolase